MVSKGRGKSSVSDVIQREGIDKQSNASDRSCKIRTWCLIIGFNKVQVIGELDKSYSCGREIADMNGFQKE